MSDRGEIIEVITRLFVGTDKRDWNAVRHCFASHVHFDMTSLAGGEPAELTPQQITDGWDAGLRPIAHVHHQAGTFLVNVHASSTEADAFCYAVAYHYRQTKSTASATTRSSWTATSSWRKTKPAREAARQILFF